jgi:protease-4
MAYYYPPPPPRPSVIGTLFRWFFRLAFLVSVGVNVLLIGLAVYGIVNLSESPRLLNERYYSGDKFASDKIAIIRVDGVILEAFNGYAEKQIESAAMDKNVKAIVLRIDSPGGSVTGSDDLYHRLRQLRDGNPRKKTPPKPIIVSMGGLAASGGYYIAMPSRKLIAEPTTTTGSIGVYISFINVAKLANDHGVKMELIKAGAVKDSGSPFKEMTPQEREVWQDSVNQTYDRFLTIVVKGRNPDLDKEDLTAPERTKLEQEKKKLLDLIPEEEKKLTVEESKTPGGPPEKHTVTYTRYRADGGIFTSEKAKKYGLIDEIGYLEDAIDAARKAAGLSEHFQAITYDRPVSLLGGLLGVQSPRQVPGAQLDPARLADGASPRLWYLAPQSEASGILSAVGRE